MLKNMFPTISGINIIHNFITEQRKRIQTYERIGLEFSIDVFQVVLCHSFPKKNLNTLCDTQGLINNI